MQNVIHYIRGVEANGYRFIGTSGFNRNAQGLDSFSEKVLVRGNFAKLDALFLPGTAHPNSATFPSFYVTAISGGQIIPANNETMCIASVEYQGIMNVAKRTVSEEYGVYVNGKYWDGTSGNAFYKPAYMPSYITKVDVQQIIPSYRRAYVTTAAQTTAKGPEYPILVGSGGGGAGTAGTTTGIMTKPSNFVPPDIPADIAWLARENQIGNYPYGWCLVNRSTQQTRLPAATNGTAGALIGIFNVSEEWHHRPLISSV